MWGSEADEQAFGAVWRLWNGDPQERNRRGAVRRLTALADAGYAPAQYALGMAYFDGQGVRRDYITAFEWFMRSAQQGYPGAQNMVGSFYASVAPRYGACEPSPAEAAKWYRRAAEAGNSAAQMNLAQACWSGLGVEPDVLDTYVWASLAVHCSPVRFSPAETLRDRASAELTPEQRGKAEERIRELEVSLPLIGAEPSVYWEDLAELHGTDP